MDLSLYSSALYVDMNIFDKNIQTLTRRHQAIIPVLKSDAYGLGLKPIAQALVKHRSVKMLAVAQVLEGAKLREYGIDTDILVLGGTLPRQWAAAAELADLLGGVVACTRPMVEDNIFDAKHQIGLSGRTVKPKLIFCLGISGAVQFAAGMKSSDCIVAINTDPAAPIFDVAHYCVVGDVNAIVPKLIAHIKGVC